MNAAAPRRVVSKACELAPLVVPQLLSAICSCGASGSCSCEAFFLSFFLSFLFRSLFCQVLLPSQGSQAGSGSQGFLPFRFPEKDIIILRQRESPSRPAAMFAGDAAASSRFLARRKAPALTVNWRLYKASIGATRRYFHRTLAILRWMPIACEEDCDRLKDR